MKLSLSDEQSLQFAEEENVKILWERIKSTFWIKKKFARNKLKNLEICHNESANNYIARAQGISTKYEALDVRCFPA